MQDDLDREVCNTIKTALMKGLAEGGSLRIQEETFHDPGMTLVIAPTNDAWKFTATVEIKFG